jgi:hypothetical protein
MKATKLVLALVMAFAASTAFACPKGTHLVGGTGAHHKGGKCVSAAEAAEAKSADKKDKEVTVGNEKAATSGATADDKSVKEAKPHGKKKAKQ